MSLFREFNQMVDSVLSNIPSTDAYARAVRRVDQPAKKYLNWPVIASLDHMQLVHDVKGRTYECVLYLDTIVMKAFRLSVSDQTIAEFTKLHQTLYPFYQRDTNHLELDVLQKIINSARSHPGWTSAHHAVEAKFEKCLDIPEIKERINVQEADNKQTPVHLAVKWNNAKMVSALIVNGAKLNIADKDGENVFHCAARLLGNIAPMLEVLAQDTSDINRYNLRGFTALQIACQQGNLDTAAGFVDLGANVKVMDSMGHPIHYAFKYQNRRAVEAILSAPDMQLDSSLCVKYGGTGLHYAKSPEFVSLVTEKGECDVNAMSKTGHTALHVMVQRQRVECALALMCTGADVRITLPGGDTPLHQAVTKNNLDMVYGLIVFGADVNALNSKGESPRHIAATQIMSSLGGLVGSSNTVLSALHLVGAQRCPATMKGCSAGCKVDGKYDGNPPTSIEVTQSEGNKAYDDFLNVCIGLLASKQRVGVATDEADGAAAPSRECDNMLCLDGGGIRGLILTQILQAIEEAAGRPISEMFDWIAGTSTGGILALALAVGYTVKDARRIYFALKNGVFIGNRPYPSEPLENYFKKVFGEETKMDSITKHKVLVMATLGDRTPPPLHIFRSYEPPACSSSATVVYRKDSFESPPLFHDQLIWKAARCSGAAPTYFQPMGAFLDGGLIANNPTLDALTELQEYYMDRQMKGESKRDVGVVVSLGTGCVPVKAIKSTIIAKPSSLLDVRNAAKAIFGAASLGEILIDQVCDARGRTLDRARAWCNMIGAPFFRFSPPLSSDIPLDESKDSTLLKMLWETEVYLYQNRDKVKQLGELLTSLH